jgi:hypothetical protein
VPPWPAASQNEANTTLLLIDNRSGVQISAAEGTAKNFDFGVFGAAWAGGLAGRAAATRTRRRARSSPRRFADSYNQMVKALRNYKAQTVKGGLGTGGRLGVQGGQTPASQQVQQAPAPAATPAASTRSTTQPKPKAPKKPAAKDPNAQGK